MNVRDVLIGFTQGQTLSSGSDQTSSLAPISSVLSDELAEGTAAGTLMALLLGSKSTLTLAEKFATIGGSAVLGGLAYKAYGNWLQNRAIGQTRPATNHDIEQASRSSSSLTDKSDVAEHNLLSTTLFKTMVAASKVDADDDVFEQKKIDDAIDQLNLSSDAKTAVFNLMDRDISIQEIANSVSLDEHKAEVYLAAYLAIEIDDQAERVFLNNLGVALKLPKGFPAYLEQQADQGVSL